MILSGVFISPGTFIRRMQSLSSEMQSGLGDLRLVTERLESGLQKIDKAGMVALVFAVLGYPVAVVGLLAVFAEWDQILQRMGMKLVVLAIIGTILFTVGLYVGAVNWERIRRLMRK